MAEIDILSINNKKIQDVEARKDIQVIKENNTAIKQDINDIKASIGTEALTTTAKDLKGAVNEVSAQYKDIANLSLALGKDGLLYIKKQDGTLIGTGVKVNNDTDLSKVTMQINGNTLILLNNGTQIASVDLPNNMSATDVSNLIKKGVSETNYNALDTTDKRIIGGINEINIHLNSTAKKTIVEGNKIYLAKSDGTKLDTGTILPTGGTGKPYDDTSIKSDISNIKNDLGTAQLTTTAQNVKGAINEIDAKCDDIAVKTITTEERTKLTNLKNYDDTSIKTDINNIKTNLGTAQLTTTAKDVKGAINEVNTQYKENQINLIEDDTSIEGISDTVHDTLNTTNKTLIGAINEVNSQLEDVANLSLAIGRDGLLYIKKQDGTLIGTGVNVSSSGTDLSKVTMRVNGNTLILLNNGIQIASVDLPSNLSETDVSNLIEKGVSETTYNNLRTTDKTIIGGINEVRDKVQDIPSLFSTEQTGEYYKIKYNNMVIASIPLNSTGGSVTPNPPATTKYTITNNLSHATNSNTTTSVDKNSSYSANITANSNYRIKTVKVTMGGTDITNTAYSNGRINISSVTGNIVITVTTESVTSEITRYTITNNLSHATNSNSATSIEEKASYNATITPNSNYRIKNVTVTMYGTDITNDVYSGGKIIIPRVIGDIVITVTTEYVSSGGGTEPDEDLSKLEGILPNRLLVWHDEFDDATLDTTKWRYATHNSGGSEQQAYTVGRTENVRIENSNLILEAKKDGYVNNWTWSSGRIDTSGLAGFKYGRLEAKLKYDVVSGAFPAFWTIGTCAYYPTGENVHGVQKSKGAQWAQNGEIDMFEGRGTNSEIVQGGWYNQDDGKGNLQMIFGSKKNMDASQYHVYAVEWTETTMIAYIDGVETGRKNISDITAWQRPQYIILNMAVGSTGGYPADDCTSMKMEVDWVRVYAPVGVTAKKEVQSISLSQNNLTFNMGDDPIDVYYTVNPSTAWDNNVNYESSDTSVAEVYGSRIYPKGIGNCKITARATNGVTATINVTVAQNASINAKSIALNKDTLSIYNGTSSTLTATVTPDNHTDSILWKSSKTDVATVSNGIVTGKNTGNCTITAYSSADSSVKAECSVSVKEAVQLTGHPTNGLTLQLDRNGMSSTSWRNAIDNTQLQWKVATNNSSDIASYMIFDGNSFYWAGANYKDHLTLSGFGNYYDFGESQTVILAGDFTNAKNPIFSNKQKLSQNTSSAYINTNEVGYIGSDGTKLGTINMTTQETGYKIDGCIALRYNKQTLRVDADTMPFTENTPTNKNVVLSSAFTQGSYPALLGNVGTAGIYFKVVLVYNRVLSDTEIQTAMRSIKTFLNS